MKEYYLDYTGELTFMIEEPPRHPLTEAQINAIVRDLQDLTAIGFARAIERAHGIVDGVEDVHEA